MFLVSILMADFVIQANPIIPGIWDQVWGVLERASPPVALFAIWMWWLERSDRMRKDLTIEGMGERTTKALGDTSNAMKGFSDILHDRKQR